MNVLYLTNNADRASTTVATAGWIENLQPRGLKAVVASPKVGEFSRQLAKRGVVCYRQELPFPDKRWPWAFLWALWKLRRIVKNHGVEMIHCNEHDTYPIGYYLARLCALPVVVGVHCRMARAFGQWAFGGRKRPDRLFFLTRGSREVCRPAVEGIVPESTWRLLYNGLDIERFCPDETGGRDFRREHKLGDGLLIGVASWLRPGKQLEHLFDVALRLQRHDFTLVLAGGIAPGEEEYAKRVLAKGQNLLGERLRYLGLLSDLRGLYNALNLYVNTSKEETCSISIIEAMACGCPVVGYPSVSVDEQILPTGGEIVPQDDRDRLVRALEKWLGDQELIQRTRRGARKKAEEMFDIRVISNQLWLEYQSLLPEAAA